MRALLILNANWALAVLKARHSQQYYSHLSVQSLLKYSSTLLGVHE
jgi:hypothetical protein